MNRHPACSTTYQFLVGWAFCPPKGTGKMPVPQHINFLWGGHLARPLEQARCLFHNTSNFLWGGHLARPLEQAGCLFHNISNFFWGGHLARPKEQASCLFHNLSISCGVGILPGTWTGKMPVPQHIKFLVGGHLARPKKTYLSPFYTLNFSTIRLIASSTFSRLLNAEMRK